MKRAESQSSSGSLEEANSSLSGFQLRVQRLNSFPLSRKFTKLSVNFLYRDVSILCALRGEDVQKEYYESVTACKEMLGRDHSVIRRPSKSLKLQFTPGISHI
jgi:hypothetical protein